MRLGLARAGLVRRRTERREPVEVSLKTAPGALGRGVLIGLAIFGFMATVAVTEELPYRGVLFRIVEERLGTWISLGLSGVMFGLAHAFNSNATPWSRRRHQPGPEQWTTAGTVASV